MCLSGQQVMGVGSHSVAVHRAIIHGYAGQLEEFFFCLTGPYLNWAGVTIGRLDLSPGEGRFVWNPPRRTIYTYPVRATPVVSFYRLPACLSSSSTHALVESRL